ncbi:hypothetical protein Zm00014a_019875 [Zea mays]|uniref:Uncharacterized protein n=1 Tax=Zea mays TaxID=4577 RepID=A0A3L6DZZ2_MAIZE|nr:hypothetical protein Zm00014a_019875 [Zea mays]
MAHANIYHHICLSPFPSLGSIQYVRSRGGRRRRREEMADGSSNSSASVAMEQEVQAFVENKYGGMVPKKPLISKQAANSGTARAATAIEFLKPKLKGQAYKSSLAGRDDEERYQVFFSWLHWLGRQIQD